MDKQTIKSIDKDFVIQNYGRADVSFISGKGSVLTDSDGKSYIDFSSGIGVNSFGLCDDSFVEAVKKQAEKLQHVSNLYYNEPYALLAEQLCKKSEMEKAFLCNSGAEANECAIKCARKYSFDNYGEGRFEIISLNNSFHGRTMATLSATGQDIFHKYFMPFNDGFAYCDANEESFQKAISSKTCAIIIEIIQGEGGMSVVSKEFTAYIAKVCKEKDILLIIDEVQTGNGRTGSMYAYLQFGLSPDIVTTAKGLGGGLPIGAVLFSKKTKDVLTVGSHGTTFGANPVCCSAALSVVNRLNDELFSEIIKKSIYIKEKLKNCSKIISIDGLGLMLGITINCDAKEVVKQCLEKGLVILTSKEKIRLLPALNISYKEIDKGIAVLSEVLK